MTSTAMKVTPVVTDAMSTSKSMNWTYSMTTTLNYYDSFNPGTPYDQAMDALLIIALILSFYLVTSLSYHEWTVCRKERSKRAHGVPPNRKSQSKIGIGLRALCILSAIFCLLRCANDIAYYKAQRMSDVPCTVLKNLGASWLIEVDTTVYLFLWLRHRVLYQNRNIRLPSNKFITVASWIAFALIIGLFVSMNVVILGWRRYTYDPVKAECKKTNPMANKVNKYLFLTGSTTLHVLLVALYVYPLARQVMIMGLPTKALPGRMVNPSAETQSPNKTNQAQSRHIPDAKKGKKGLMHVVIKCVLLSLLCVITDGVTIIVTSTVFMETKLRHFLYNINVILNTVAIVASLTDWRHMLFPYSCLFQYDFKRKETTPDGTNITNIKVKQTCAT